MKHCEIGESSIDSLKWIKKSFRRNYSNSDQTKKFNSKNETALAINSICECMEVGSQSISLRTSQSYIVKVSMRNLLSSN